MAISDHQQRNIPHRKSPEFFGSATCIHVLEHVPNPDNVIQEIYRVLQAGGTFYLETPNPRSLYMPRMSRKSTWNFYDDPTHIRPYSASALARLCEANGFVIKKAGIYRRWRYALATSATHQHVHAGLASFSLCHDPCDGLEQLLSLRKTNLKRRCLKM